jgi:hypothetical protein
MLATTYIAGEIEAITEDLRRYGFDRQGTGIGVTAWVRDMLARPIIHIGLRPSRTLALVDGSIIAVHHSATREDWVDFLTDKPCRYLSWSTWLRNVEMKQLNDGG